MRTVFVLLLCAACALARNVHIDEDMLPGWMGTDYNPPSPRRHPDVVTLHAEARIFLWKKFLSIEEADHIRRISDARMTRSGVTAGNGSSEVSDIRTSFGVFLERGEDDIIKRIEERIAEWSMMPVENGEGLQVLRYRHGQKYDAHWDWFFDSASVKNGGNRYATVLMYLADVEEGGETAFPKVPAPGGENPGFSDCAARYLAAKPRKGDAILFHSAQPDGSLEKRSLHVACPVIKGEKWSAAKWIHTHKYNFGYERDDAGERTGECVDRSDMCDAWADAGECTKNPAFMVGDRQHLGACLLSCKRCDLWTLKQS